MKSVDFICMTTYENMNSTVRKAEVRAFAKSIVKEFKEGLARAEQEDRKIWETKQRSKPNAAVNIKLKDRNITIHFKKRRSQQQLPGYRPKVTCYRRSRSPHEPWGERPHCSHTPNYPRQGGWRKVGPSEISRMEELEMTNIENMSRIDDLEEDLESQHDWVKGTGDRLEKLEQQVTGILTG